jgi:hypothetical protein
MSGRWWTGRRALGVVTVCAVVAAAGVAVAYRARIAPPYPAVAGRAYPISLDPGGCPVLPGSPAFVDAPGELVPPDPVEAVLCSLPTGLIPRQPDLPRTRVVRAGAPGFAAFLNRLPDRNTAWRDRQRRHSGLWPDSPPEYMCPAIGYPYDFAYVLRYSDRPPVALYSLCGTGGLTTGVRTRVEDARPDALDEFNRLLAVEGG